MDHVGELPPMAPRSIYQPEMGLPIVRSQEKRIETYLRKHMVEVSFERATVNITVSYHYTAMGWRTVPSVE